MVAGRNCNCHLVLAVALLRPNMLAPLNRMWTKLEAMLMAMVVSPIVLGLLFSVVVTRWDC